MTLESRLSNIITSRWKADEKSGQRDVNDIINWYHDYYLPVVKSKADAAISRLVEYSVTMDTSEYELADYAGMTFPEIKLKAQGSADLLADKVCQVLQKAGKVPALESVTKDQFEKYQSLFATSFPIMMENENGQMGVAVWNDEKSMRNGSRVLPLTDFEIKGIKASVGF